MYEVPFADVPDDDDRQTARADYRCPICGRQKRAICDTCDRHKPEEYRDWLESRKLSTRDSRLPKTTRRTSELPRTTRRTPGI